MRATTGSAAMSGAGSAALVACLVEANVVRPIVEAWIAYGARVEIEAAEREADRAVANKSIEKKG
jgi:hypothetical protein